MSSQVVSFLITARDNASAALGKVQKGFKKTGTAATGFGKSALIGAAGLVGMTLGVRNLLKETTEFGAVQSRLKSALDLSGASVAQQLPAMNTWAARLQDMTNVSDEQSNALVTLAINQGNSIEKSKELVLTSIGLGKALNIDVLTAMKHVTRGSAGVWGELGELVPRIRNATTQSEKMAIAMELADKGMATAKEGTKTFGGQIEKLKNNWSDLQQQIGTVLVNPFLPLLESLNELLARANLRELGNIEHFRRFAVLSDEEEKALDRRRDELLVAIQHAQDTPDPRNRPLSELAAEKAKEEAGKAISAASLVDPRIIQATSVLEGIRRRGPTPLDRFAATPQEFIVKKLGDFRLNIAAALAKGAAEKFNAPQGSPVFKMLDAMLLQFNQAQKFGKFDDSFAKKDKDDGFVKGINQATESRLLTRIPGGDAMKSTAEHTRRVAENVKTHTTILTQQTALLAKIAKRGQPKIITGNKP